MVGIPILLQYAISNDPVTLHYVFNQKVSNTLNLIEKFTKFGIVGFNLTFDWFHINKLYNIFIKISNKDKNPNIDEVFEIEKGNPSDFCVKPSSALDLYLHALKGPYQSVMDRKPLYIRKIPKVLAEELISVLNTRIKFKRLFFARSESKEGGWEIVEVKDKDGKVIPDLVDLVLRFRPSAGLKILAADAFDTDYKLLAEINELQHPEMEQWKPYGWDWRPYFRSHSDYWEKDTRAIKYATDDIIITRKLDEYFGLPELGDDDSILATAVGAIRWKGYKVDLDKARELKQIYINRMVGVPQSPNEVKAYLKQFMSPIEQLALVSTAKVVLEDMEGWESGELTDDAESGDNIRPDNKDIEALLDWKNDNGILHPAAKAAHTVLQARRAKKRIDIIEKLEATNGRLHPDFRIIGAKSGRMSGAGGLNPQGIPRDPEFRSMFLFADSDEQLHGGDFQSFEITIADAVYCDPIMHAELLEGKKFHALFGASIYGLTYEEVKNDKQKYNQAKGGAFALLYGAQAQKVSNTMGISLESAEQGYQRFITKYKKVGEKRAEINNRFCSMTQPDGIGSKIHWKDPDDYIETLLGFRRYFTLENQVCKSLFELASNLPENFRKIKIKVIRRDRMQTAAGAICSALYGSAFNIQAQNMRAAANHVIQGTGSQICKALQVEIWTHQPIGISVFVVRPMNIHDELMSPNKQSVKVSVDHVVNKYRSVVPLLGIDWSEKLTNWSDK